MSDKIRLEMAEVIERIKALHPALEQMRGALRAHGQ